MAGKGKKIQEVEAQYTEEKGIVQPLSIDNLTDATFAALDVTMSDTLPIMDIRADMTQPRRIIPREVRGTFSGFPEGVPALLDVWHDAVMDEIDELPVTEILNGRAAAFDYVAGSSVVTEFVKLLDLAAQIHDVGLQQAIGVRKLPKNKYEIIFGERRWMAFHTLTHFGISGFDVIPVKVSTATAFDFAKIQAAENMQRDELNAISKARQLAKLIILARQETQDPAYDNWAALVVAGGCDRPWYAQVQDGNKHPIPRGMGPVFEQTLGISVEQMRQYRALLQLTDDYEVNNRLWEMADEGNWAERFIREIGQHLDLDAIRTILKEAPDPEDMFREAIAASKPVIKPQRTVTMVTPHDVDEPEEDDESVDKSGWASAYWEQRWAYASSALVWVMEAVDPNIVKVVTGDGNVIDEGAVPVTVHVSVMHERDVMKPAFRVDDRVHVVGIGAGVIRYVKDGKYGVYLDSSGSTHYYPAAQLSLIAAPDPISVLEAGQRVALATNRTLKGVVEERTGNRYGVRLETSGKLNWYDRRDLVVSADSDNADTPSPETLVPENWVGKAVKSPVNGEIGLVTTDDGDYVRVKWSRGYYSNHQKDALTVVSYQLWIDAMKPKDWTGLYVQTVVGAVAGVVKDNGAAVDLIFPDNHQVSQQKQFLSLVDKREWDEAVERHKNALTPQALTPSPSPSVRGEQTGSEKLTYPAQTQGHGLTTVQLVGKPVLYQGQPAVVVGASGSENVVIQLGKERVPVHKDLLVLNNGAMGQRLKDVMTQPPSTPTALTQGAGSEVQVSMLLEEFGEDYNLISAVQMCAQEVGNHDAVEALEQLLGIEADVNPGQLGLLLDECFAHTKEVMAAMEQRVGQRFAAILKAAGDGTD